jgi:mannose-6-phosphate isomerase-like protein (cupin superfamily)
MTTLRLTPSETVTIRSSTPEAFEVEATYGPGGSPPPKHLHPAQDEHFEVIAGSLSARVGDESLSLSAGDRLDIPRQVPHQMWNPNEEPARVAWTTTPGGRTEEWMRTLDRLQREGKVGSKGMPGLLAFATYLTEYKDVFRLAAGPRPVVQGLLAALAPLGRLKGY